MAQRAVQFFQKPSCTTCRKAKTYLESHGVRLEFRDLDKERLSERELDQLIGERDYLPFLNPRNELYRSRGMKAKPPSRAEAIRLMARNPNLIRRPVILRGGEILLGFDQDACRRLLDEA